MVVVKIGGSLLQRKGGKISSKVLREYAELIKSNEHMIEGVVFGGGRTAKEYIDVAAEFDLSDNQLDKIGIYATQLHAGMMSQVLGERYEMKRSIEEVDEYESRVPVMGGTEPGHTTDAVSLLLCSELESERCVIATDVNGIYDTSDDKDIQHAEKFDSINTEELRELLENCSDDPGRNIPIDRKSVDIIEENNFEVTICRGDVISDLKDAIKGNPVGTRIIK